MSGRTQPLGWTDKEVKMLTLEAATKVTAEAAAIAKSVGWSVKKYRSLSHRRGVAYEADLYLNSKKVGYVECKGIGDGAAARFHSDAIAAKTLFDDCAATAFNGTEFKFMADEMFVEAVLQASGK
jgi:hypothetical protein